MVVVTVNHRLNAFGYLYLAISTARFAASGNVGQLDLVQALQWVREHAAEFGGDAGNVTVFGQSGGGAKIATLMAMPAAKGLFHRAWTMSGQQVTAAGPRAAAQRAQIAMQAVGAEFLRDDSVAGVAHQLVDARAREEAQVGAVEQAAVVVRKAPAKDRETASPHADVGDGDHRTALRRQQRAQSGQHLGGSPDVLENVAQHDDVEWALDARPVLAALQVAHDDPFAVPLGERPALRRHLEPGHRAPALRQEPRGRSGGAPGVEHARATRDRGQLQSVRCVENRGGNVAVVCAQLRDGVCARRPSVPRGHSRRVDGRNPQAAAGRR